MLSTTPLARRQGLPTTRQVAGLHTYNARSIFPLLGANNSYSRMVRQLDDYQGRRPADSDHDLPNMHSKKSGNYRSVHHVWTNWDKRLNPQIISGPDTLKPVDEYVGPRCGHYLDDVGWMRIGGSWRFKNSLTKRRNQLYAKDYQWLETVTTPRWQLVPRIADFNPQSRYAGKLEYVELGLSKIIWAIDTGKLNRNEVLTLWHLHDAGIVREADVVWPGVKLVDDLPRDAKLRYPVSIELQNGTTDAIRRIERAGGSFVSAYLSLDGLYQTMHPEEYPVFVDQNVPDREGMTQVAVSDRARGYLCRWFESQAKYAHPEAGRRLSHYVRPPTDRDFPATYEEYERVKHHQKWHLNQPGTGTILPFISTKSLEDAPNAPEMLQNNK